MNSKGCASPAATGRSVLWPGCIIFLAVCIATPFAQDATEPSLKAALIFNFAKFTTWPDGTLPPTAPFVACMVGDDAIGDALERSVKGRLLAGHSVAVTHPGPGASLRRCHLLYVGSVDAARMSRALNEVRGLPVLSIADTENVDAECIVRVFVENGRMRFDLDNGLARRSRMLLSSKILTLASRVKDEWGKVRP